MPEGPETNCLAAIHNCRRTKNSQDCSLVATHAMEWVEFGLCNFRTETICSMARFFPEVWTEWSGFQLVNKKNVLRGLPPLTIQGPRM